MKTAIAMLALMTTPAAAAGDVQCMTTAELIGGLTESYAEQAVFAGLSDEGSVVSLHMSLSGTWSLVITGAYGDSCLAAFGTEGKLRP